MSRVDLAQFFCEDLQTFKLEDCFKILHSFVARWNLAAVENKRRKQLEEEARQRKKIREEQFQKRLQLGWETPQSVENFNNTVFLICFLLQILSKSRSVVVNRG